MEAGKRERVVAYGADVMLGLPDTPAFDARARMERVDDAPPEDVHCDRRRGKEEVPCDWPRGNLGLSSRGSSKVLEAMGAEHDSCRELLSVANELAAGASESRGRAVAAVLAAHGALEALVNRIGGEEIPSFNYRARFLPKWHDLCERTLGRQLESAPELERLHALRDSVMGFRGEPERLDRRSPAPPPVVPGELRPRTARWAVETARRVIDEFREAAGGDLAARL